MNKDIEEAAKQIVDKYVQLFIQSNADNWREPSRQAAIIHVDGIIEAIHLIEKDYYKGYFSNDIKHYNEIKSAIQKL